jgi:hypothetical protein
MSHGQIPAVYWNNQISRGTRIPKIANIVLLASEHNSNVTIRDGLEPVRSDKYTLQDARYTRFTLGSLQPNGARGASFARFSGSRVSCVTSGARDSGFPGFPGGSTNRTCRAEFALRPYSASNLPIATYSGWDIAGRGRLVERVDSPIRLDENNLSIELIL